MPAARISTDFPLGPDTEGPREIVILCSVEAGGTFRATAVRIWVTDPDGIGLEADLTDPVDILASPAGPLDAFHVRALAELEARRRIDYEVADLFAPAIWADTPGR